MGDSGMKIVFNGAMERRTSGGCNCRGKVTDASFVSNKLYILPSGQTKRFYIGKVETVSDRDAKFLLSYTYTDAHGNRKAVFSEAE